MTRPMTAVRPAILLAALLLAAPAMAGSIEVAPGATARIDVGDRSGHTTLVLTNRGTAATAVELGAPLNRAVELPPGGRVEIYERMSGGGLGSTLSLTNRGPAPVRAVSRYAETLRLP